MIIVEGPDGAGKSTLIKRMADALDLPIAPRVVSKTAEALVDLKVWVEENLNQGFQPMIYDRHRLISEPIYGPILRKEQERGFSDFNWLQRQLDGLYYHVQPFIIYCLPPLTTVKANLRDDFDNVVVAGHIDQIYSAYIARAALDYTLAQLNIVAYDYTADGNGSVAQTIIDQIQERIKDE